MMKKHGVLVMSLLVVGNLIGAGILALPIQTGCAGLVFSVSLMVLFCAAMYFSAFILAGEAIEAKTDNFNYPSLYQHYLGSIGKWVAVIANMLILYGLLTAYLCGGTSILLGVFDLPVDSRLWQIGTVLILFAGLTTFSLCGANVIARYNGFLMIALGASFAVIVIMGALKVEPERELFFNMKFVPIAVPVILTAFHFHNIIPSICKQLDWNKKSINRSMQIGMIIGFVMNVTWVAVGIGVLPLTFGHHSIIYAFEHGLPATVPIAKILNIPAFSVIAAVFALVAICTSFIANGMGLMDFNRDLLFNTLKKKSHKFVVILTFLPPLLIAVLFPHVFLKAIGVVGGIGIAILFGVLPATICFIRFKSVKARILAVTVAILFVAALGADLLNDFGIIDSSVIIEEMKQSPMSEPQP